MNKYDIDLTQANETERLEIYKRPDVLAEDATHLRCISAKPSDDSFSVGTTYEVLRVDSDGDYLLLGDDNYEWIIDCKTLEGCFGSYVGTFEIVRPEREQVKTKPEFGDLVHYKGTPYIFIRVDPDDDYVLRAMDDGVCHVDLEEIDEYAPNPTAELRKQVLNDLRAWHSDGLQDSWLSTTDISTSDLIDFIIGHKDNWA